MKVTRIVFLTCAITMLLVGVAFCDPTIKVTFPEKGSYLYWFDAKGADGKPVVTAPKRISGADGQVDLAPAVTDGKAAKGELRVYDPKSGNIAAKSIENLKDKKELTLKGADFDRIGRLRIILKPADGKPEDRVESAVVTLTDVNSEVYTTVVDPSSEGVAEFRNVAGGMETVAIAAGNGKTTVQMEAKLDRKDSVFTYAIPISGDVRTIKVSAPAAKAGEKAEMPGKKTEVTVVGGWATSLVGIIALALIAFIVYTIVKSKGMTLEKALRQAGVQFPQDTGADTIPANGGSSAPAAPAIDPSMCQFCGQRKDGNGRCACSVDAGGTAVATATGVPRLVGMQGPYMGRIFEIQGSEMTIGRDMANTLPLNEDTTSSRRHAKIDQSGGSFTIVDVGSSNGTFVNGMKITGSQPLRQGDEVQIGSTKFRFEL